MAFTPSSRRAPCRRATAWSSTNPNPNPNPNPKPNSSPNPNPNPNSSPNSNQGARLEVSAKAKGVELLLPVDYVVADRFEGGEHSAKVVSCTHYGCTYYGEHSAKVFTLTLTLALTLTMNLALALTLT